MTACLSCKLKGECDPYITGAIDVLLDEDKICFYNPSKYWPIKKFKSGNKKRYY